MRMPIKPGPCPSPSALRIWEACRGIDWTALEILCEIHGVTDVEILIVELTAIRSFKEKQSV